MWSLTWKRVLLQRPVELWGGQAHRPQHSQSNGWLQLAHAGSVASSSTALQLGESELLVLHPFVLSPVERRSIAAAPT